MPLDERLHSGLTRDAAYRPADEQQALARVMARAGQRRRMRGVALGAAAAVLLVLAAVAVPWALRTVRADDPVVEQPTSPSQTSLSIDAWRPPDRGTPIDDPQWGTAIVAQEQRLQALEGSGLERFGPQVFRRASMRLAGSQMELMEGNFMARVQSHNMGTLELVPYGTFEVHGPRIVVTFTETGDEVVFRWSKPDEDHLKLTFVSTTVPTMHGAPAEVFFRMFTAAPFRADGT